jgi:hypothetical protein
MPSDSHFLNISFWICSHSEKLKNLPEVCGLWEVGRYAGLSELAPAPLCCPTFLQPWLGMPDSWEYKTGLIPGTSLGWRGSLQVRSLWCGKEVVALEGMEVWLKELACVLVRWNFKFCSATYYLYNIRINDMALLSSIFLICKGGH